VPPAINGSPVPGGGDPLRCPYGTPEGAGHVVDMATGPMSASALSSEHAAEDLWL